MRKRFVDGFHYDAHPMGMFISSLAALGTFYDDAKDIFDPESRHKQILRLIAKAPTLAAMCYRFSVGLPFFLPDNSLSYPANFLTMMWKIGEYEVHPALERAMDVLFILHADHEQNCGTTAMRVVASSHADPYSAAAAAAAALYGPLHGGANEAVVRMLGEIGSIDDVPAFVDDVKSGKGRLMGFGHRVYKNYDPRARIIKQTAYDVFEVTGKNPLLDIALKLEETALEDPYFVDRKLYPNVDFYSGLIYQALGFPVDMFTVLFAIPRMSGWLAHWDELLDDKDQKISRPRQWYAGPASATTSSSATADRRRRSATDDVRPSDVAACYAIFSWRRRSRAARNSSVVCHGASRPMRRARSLVISPASTASMHTGSSVSANFVTSGVSSSLPRCFEATGPGEDRRDRVGRRLVALLVLAVVAGDGAVGRLGLDRLAVRGHQHRRHQAERAEPLGDGVGLHVAVVVLARPDVAALPLHHLGDHVVDQAVLVGQAGGLEVGLELVVEDLLEEVLEHRRRRP